MTKIDKAERDRVIAAAVSDGKIAARSRGGYEQMWARTPDAARQLLTASVNEGGLMGGLMLGGDDGSTADVHVGPGDYNPMWFPELRDREAEGKAIDAAMSAPRDYPDRWLPETRTPRSSRVTRVD